MPQSNMFYSKTGLRTRSTCVQKKVAPKLDSKSVPSACDTGALPSKLLEVLNEKVGDKIRAVSDVRSFATDTMSRKCPEKGC